MADIGDAAAGFEEVGFVNEVDGTAFVASVGEGGIIGFGAVVGIDDEAVDASCEQVVEGVGDQRSAAERYEWFWKVFGECSEPGSKTGTEHESGLHEASIAVWWVFAKT